MAGILTAYYAATDVLHAADLPLLYGAPLGFALAGLVALEALRPWFIRRQIRTLLGRAPRDAFLGHKRLEASPEGLTITATTSTTQCEWAAITHVDETSQHLFLMLGNASGIIIPKRGQPQAALDALRACLAAKAAATGAVEVPA
nr:YcxB family protein [Plastoroseomonas arctica]